MKKFFIFLLTTMCIFCLIGCGSADKASNANEKKVEASASVVGKKPLVVYFSYSGKTAAIAKAVANAAKADTFEIKTVKPYPQSYRECADYAKDEKNRNFHPEIQGNVANIKEYDTILLGFPIWWYDAPMAVYTFIDKHDLSGKTVISFCTSGGSPISESTTGLKSALSKSKFIEGLRFSHNDTSAVEKWVKDLGF